MNATCILLREVKANGKAGASAVSTNTWKAAAIVLATAIMLPLCALGQDSARPAANITATASSEEIQVAEPFTFTITCRASEGCQVSFPQLTNQLADFDIVRVDDQFDIPEDNDEGRTWTRILTLESIVTGERVIPPLEVRVSSENGAQRLETEPVLIRVLSVLEDGTDPLNIRDIRPLIDVPMSPPQDASSNWMPWVGGILLAAAGTGAFYLLRRRSYLTPKQWATEQLERLDETNSSQSGERVEQLIQTVSRFLQLQLNVDAPAQTTPELLEHAVIKNQLSEASWSLAKSLLEAADRVKYAGSPIDNSQVKQMIQQARQLIHQVADEEIPAARE